MKPEELLKWIQVGTTLVTAIGVPVAKVIAFFRQEGVPDEQLVELELLWSGMTRQIEARIAALKAAGVGQ